MTAYRSPILDYECSSIESVIETGDFVPEDFVDLHTTSNDMIFWCMNLGLKYGRDYTVTTFRIKTKSANSHRWYFKNCADALAFKIMWG